MATDFFVFCWQPKSWTTRAVLVPFNLLDEQRRKEIIYFHDKGPIFYEQWTSDQSNNNFIFNGFKLSNGEILNPQKLSQFLMGWEHFADHGEQLVMFEEKSDEWKRESMFYWMDNKKGSKSPEELHKLLCEMESFEGHPIHIKYCIIKTEMKLNERKNMTLRFFYKKDLALSKEQFKNMILEIIGNNEENRITLCTKEGEENSYGLDRKSVV